MQQQQVEETEKSFEEVAVPYLEDLLETLKSGATMAQEELPELIEQYIVFHAVIAWIAITAGVIVFLTGFIAFKKIKEEFDPARWFAAIVLFISGGALVINNLLIAIKATFFPKLFIVEEFIKLL